MAVEPVIDWLIESGEALVNTAEMSVTCPVAGVQAESVPPASFPKYTVPSGATAMSWRVPGPLTRIRAETEGSMVNPGIVTDAGFGRGAELGVGGP